MSSKLRPYLRFAPMAASGRGRLWWFMASDSGEARREASHWYVRLREDEGDPAVQAAFAEWLDASPLHGAAWKSMCETMDAVGHAPEEWRSPPLSRQSPGQSRRGGRTGRAAQMPQKPRRRLRIAAGAVAAACALALLLPSISLRLQADHATGAGHVEQVRLADGSTVQIGPDSAIAVDYGDGGRTVRLLSGQAMFDVRHDPSRPFRVEAGDVVTTVLGTSFDVRMLGGATSVAVARGHVRVDDGGAQPMATHDLLAGDWLRVGDGQVAETGRLTPQLVGGWQKGEALAENRTIGSVIDEIRPWFGGRIFLNDARLASRRVTGIYDVKDPERALEMIVRPYGGRITRITPWVLIVSGS